MARKRNVNTVTTDNIVSTTSEEAKDVSLVLSDPGQMTEKKAEQPRMVNITPDGRIRRIDY